MEELAEQAARLQRGDGVRLLALLVQQPAAEHHQHAQHVVLELAVGGGEVDVPEVGRRLRVVVGRARHLLQQDELVPQQLHHQRPRLAVGSTVTPHEALLYNLTTGKCIVLGADAPRCVRRDCVRVSDAMR